MTVSVRVTVVLLSTGLAVRLGLGQAQLLAREAELGGYRTGSKVWEPPNPQESKQSIRTACDVENIWLAGSDHTPISKCLASSVPHPQRGFCEDRAGHIAF